MTLGWETTTDDVLGGVDLSGKRILTTGASAGLGVETIRALAARGATVIGAARDIAKARRALAAAGVADIELVEVDLASLASVRKATDEIVAQGKPLDVIIANAGVMACPQGKTADGFETQFGTNHLGHFVFVNRLAPLLRDSARVVVLSSSGHRFSDVDLDDPNFERTPYEPFVAYGRSKTANALFAVGLDGRLRPRGVRACSVHPGAIQTELGRHLSAEAIEALRERVRTGNIRFKSIPQGAATSVWCATVAPAEEIGGRFCEDCHVAELDDASTLGRGVKSYALDSTRADALWAKSEEMARERFPLSG
jgi:NAD(P)-dependent dehydrogenase (short-subunit alcohol dehydrogenase family)